MYWKLEALTAKRTEVTQTIEGSLEDVKRQVELYSLEILNIQPDYPALIKSMFEHKRLSSAMMAMFFSDFADMQRSGMSVNESIQTLQETVSGLSLKEALKKAGHFINDGRSLEEAFEHAKIFPKIVTVTISAAEKTGNITELLDVLAQYFRFKSENTKKIIKSLVYPCVVFCLLSVLSVFISIVLVPQLKTFLPATSANNFSAVILIGYAGFIKEHWWAVILFLAMGVWLVKYFWDSSRDKLMAVIFSFPLIGAVMKNMQLSNLFMNLYVYQKSGINIIQTLSNIHQAHQTYVTAKLMVIREKIFKGSSLADAVAQDKFFPVFVCQHLLKGQVSGCWPAYFERIYKYYDAKSKDSINAAIAMVEPVLMAMAASFLLMIVCAFILPIYSNMNTMGTMGLK